MRRDNKIESWNYHISLIMPFAYYTVWILSTSMRFMFKDFTDMWALFEPKIQSHNVQLIHWVTETRIINSTTCITYHQNMFRLYRKICLIDGGSDIHDLSEKYFDSNGYISFVQRGNSSWNRCLTALWRLTQRDRIYVYEGLWVNLSKSDIHALLQAQLSFSLLKLMTIYSSWSSLGI